MTHCTHIGRHVSQLKEHHDPHLVEEALDTCRLCLRGDEVRKNDGSRVGDPDCLHYLRALDDVFGTSVSSFAKVNFILAGCTSAKGLS